MSELEIFIAGALTLMVFSYLYKENPAYRLAEHIFIGVATGRAVVLSWEYLAKNAWTPMVEGEYHYILAFILGSLFLFQFSKKYSYVKRYPIALTTGMGMGLTLGATLLSWLVRQVQATFIPLFMQENTVETFSNLFIAIGTVCGISYFILTKEHKGILTIPTKIGRYIIMITFGTHFGYTVMARMSLLIGRITDLLRYPSCYEIPAAFIIVIVAAIIERTKRSPL